jgi:hypothetical protein
MRQGRLRGFTLALTLAGTLLVASPATAATFFAAPGSTRTTQPCAQDTPCRLDYAMLAVGSGSDVSLAPGDYYDTGTTPLPGLPPVQSGVIVHGSSVSDPPVIHGHVFVNATPFLEVKSGGTIRDLELISDVESKTGNFYGYTLQIDPTAVVTRVVAHGVGAAGVGMSACAMLGGTLLDTACTGSGSAGSVNAVGANSSASTTYVLRNVTAITTAVAGTGVTMGTFNQTVSMTATNVIARGTNNDVTLVANDPAGSATLTIDHSNWGTFSSSGNGTKTLTQGTGNQTGPTAATPLFVNAGAGDYRQATGSPTIDAGLTDDANGQLALGGLSRVLGLRTDIGAYEHVPAPSATSGAATGVTDTSARIAGTVLTDGTATTTRFEYGTSNNYGRTVNLPTVAAAAGPTPVTANLTGLAPDTTYHYRLVVSAGTVTSRGQDRTLHTLDTPAGTQVTPAVVSAVTIGTRWRLGRHLPEISRKRRPPVGTTIAFNLSKGAQVTLTFSQKVSGRVSRGHCRRRSSRNRGKRHCTLTAVRGKISLAGYAGRNSLHFEGRISSGRKLKPGRHLLTISPVGASTSRSVSFTIVR